MARESAFEKFFREEVDAGFEDMRRDFNRPPAFDVPLTKVSMWRRVWRKITRIGRPS